MLPERIALIGFMAGGKSSVGKSLASRLGYCFIDLDSRIEAEAEMSIHHIFAREGESGFRKRESLALQQLANEHDVVLSTGGGAVLLEQNRTLLVRNFHVVWIKISAEESVRRAMLKPGTRPLLECSKPVDRARTLILEREGFYRHCAGFTIETSATTTVRGMAEAIHGYYCSTFLDRR